MKIFMAKKAPSMCVELELKLIRNLKLSSAAGLCKT